MLNPPQSSPESQVRSRYSSAALNRETSLCCPPINYDPRLLDAIPDEVIAKDYGCGDPSPHLQPGETVLDLGSGTGKICFIASQIVGPKGRVIGVDMTHEMLGVARRNAPIVAQRLGYSNVTFHKARIQDLALDLEALDLALHQNPISNSESFLAAELLTQQLRASQPLIASHSIDVVVSNCVLNLVDPASKPALFTEIFRVLKHSGRAVISDIVSDKPVPLALQRDPELWSGCISGALTQHQFIEAFTRAGFTQVQILKSDPEPWRVIDNIAFRAVTVQASKGQANLTRTDPGCCASNPRGACC